MGHLFKRFAQVKDCNVSFFLLSKFSPNACISVTSCVSVDLLDRNHIMENFVVFKSFHQVPHHYVFQQLTADASKGYRSVI